jgi:hypothetical protein
MTVVLVMLCLVVGALELWAGKQSKDQAKAFARRIDELRDEVGKQNGVLVTVGEQLTAELSRVKREVLPGLDNRLRHNTGQIEELGALVRQAEDYLRSQATRLHELEQQRITLSALRRKLTDLESSLSSLTRRPAEQPGPDGRVDVALERLAELERSGTEMMTLQRDLTRTLEDVEDVVADLLHYAGSELDEAVNDTLRHGKPQFTGVLVSGRLWSRDPQLQDVLAKVYEQCLREARLTVRFRTVESPLDPAETPERRRYFLAGQSLEDLVGGFTALLISTGSDLRRAALLPTDVRVAGAEHPADRPMPQDEAALKTLLRALFESDGATAQIGPFFAVRTREELLCAVLTAGQSLELENDEVFWDPSAAALRLRRLAAHQIWELTDWATRLPAP